MTELIAPKVVLWRHGQTDWNVVNRFQGHSDIPLNDVGHYQVNHAAKILAGMNPTRIISSDLIRAKQTAQALLDLTGLTLEVDPDLRETNGGKWEGKTGAENRAEDGVRFTQWLSGEDVAAGETGEKRSEVASRAMSAIERAVAGRNSVENETIVFVVLTTLLCFTDGTLDPALGSKIGLFVTFMILFSVRALQLYLPHLRIW